MYFGLMSSPFPGNIALLPLRTRTRGPAYQLPPLPAEHPAHAEVDPSSESYDPIDEILSLFRANTFFRNFEIKGPADRLLIYGILFLSECLGKVRSNMGPRDAEKVRQVTGRNIRWMRSKCNWTLLRHRVSKVEKKKGGLGWLT
jgi:hypothetical protein